MEENAMMQELIRMQEKTAVWQKITGIALIALFLIIGVALMIVIPRVNRAINQMNETMQTVDTLAEQAEASLAEIDKLVNIGQNSLTGIDSMVKSVDDFVTDNTDNVNQAVGHFNQIDFDSLNQAIEDLKDVVEPLANFARRFQ
ncbi:MAG: hypothetical protein IJ744_04965 [Lachnospiraceae bacterium]|nr:hypothetical protein [Lachnospiraceae bacterium]